jgi:DNA polymerase-1
LQKEQARLRGFVQTYFGRMRLLPQITSQNSAEAKFFENIAVNSPVQGTAADIMKMGMIAVQKELHHQGLKTKIILQVHDEIVLEGPLEEAVKIDEILKNALEKAVEFALPLQIDLGHGKNWLEAKQNEPHKL